ncbi:hypothetical protein [Mycoplasma phocimorsus]|nr:hypothetical protein [Mycoplasma phocimorsus]MDJ1646555.1 hypothetical protein [Mycoplasma phocimorsus]
MIKNRQFKNKLLGIIKQSKKIVKNFKTFKIKIEKQRQTNKLELK